MSKGKTFKIKPRSEVEEIVTDFVVSNQLHALYGKDIEGEFIVRFSVREEYEDEEEVSDDKL